MTYQHAIQRLRSATMAPKRTPAKTKADDTDDKDSLSQPTYDNQLRNLMLFLVHLKRWLPRQVPGTSTFIKFYYSKICFIRTLSIRTQASRRRFAKNAV